MDFQAIRNRCAARFRDPNGIIVTDAEWKEYVNAAYRQVNASEPYWPGAETFLANGELAFSAGDRAQPLPTGMHRVTAVYDATNQVPLVPLEGRSDFLDTWPQDGQGKPQHYRVRGNTLELYPLPDTAVTVAVEGFVAPADLVNNADKPWFPPEFHDVLVEGALADAYVDDGALEHAQVHQAAFSGILDAMRRTLLQPRQERYHQIVDTWDL